MTMRRQLISLLTVAMAFTAVAAPRETVTMKDGSVYMGHTSVKNFDKGFSTFKVDSAIVVAKNKDITILENQKKLSDLSQKWQTWFRNHPQYISKNEDGNESVTMFYMSENNSDKNGMDVVLLERGMDYYKYWSMAILDLEIADADVSSFEYSLRNPLEITGIIDEVECTDGNILRGEIVRESPKGIGVFTNDKVLEIIPYSKVVATHKKPLFKELPIDRQVKYLDVLKTDNGEYSGIITEINYKPADKKKPFYLLRISEDDMRSIPFEDVREIRIRKNKDYKSISDIRIKSADDIYVNDVVVDSTLFEFNEKQIAYDFSTTPNFNKISLSMNQKLKVVVKKDDKNNKLYLIRLINVRDDRKKGRISSFTNEQLINNEISGHRTVSPYGNVMIEYDVSAGKYVLYRPSDKRAYILQISK